MRAGSGAKVLLAPSTIEMSNSRPGCMIRAKIADRSQEKNNQATHSFSTAPRLTAFTKLVAGSPYV